MRRGCQVVVSAILALAAGGARADQAMPAEPAPDPQSMAIQGGLEAAQPGLHRCWEKGAADEIGRAHV